MLQASRAFRYPLLALIALLALAALPSRHRLEAAPGGCLPGEVQHVVYLQFDNTHFRRDRANVPSDLEQMPHLLNFLRDNGTLFTNDHTILISHTAGGILASLTGLYPDRNGQAVSNSYRYFTNTTATGTNSSSSFKYWTDLTDDVNATPLDGAYNMVTDGGKNTPAPWVPFTRAGCDFGAVATANVVLENTGTGPHGDITLAFGNPSPEATEVTTANALPNTPANAQAKAQPQADFVGLAVHCGQSSSLCSSASARPDLLPDEPGGYAGFKALYGAKYVDPTITGQPATVPVKDMFGNPITDPTGNPGFPGFDGMSAAVSLGYVAQMLEAGIPVTYAYISDAHDAHPTGPAYGPGEAGYQAALKSYDDAFAAFFQRLQNHGMNKSNTLFVVTVDEGDHFAGGSGTPQTDGSLAYTHADCSVLTSCPANQIGEVNLNIQSVLTEPGVTFTAHSDSAPTFYLVDSTTKAPLARTDPKVRKMERDIAALNFIDPYLGTSPSPVMHRMVDAVGEKALHMVTANPLRTPTFTLFANPDYFIFAASGGPNCPAAVANPCIDYHFAWSHGDVQEDIANTWVGMVGPGVDHGGLDSKTWTDHVNVRPTMLVLAGLKDDYVSDGRVLIEALETKATPKELVAHRETVRRLGEVYEQLNAPFGQFSMSVILASTNAIKSSDETAYGNAENAIASLTSQRDGLAAQIRGLLNGAAFNGQALNEQQAKAALDQANALISQAGSLGSP